MMKLELESKYSVPQMETIDRLGQCSIVFSTTLVIVDFDLILERFMQSGKLDNSRILSELDEAENQNGAVEEKTEL